MCKIIYEQNLWPVLRMLAYLVFLASSSLLLVESAVSFDICPRHQWGSETTEESWNCSFFGVNTCTKTTRSCSFSGRLEVKYGVNEYGWDGELIPPTLGGTGWDCRNYFNCFNWEFIICNVRVIGSNASTVGTHAVAAEQESHEEEFLGQVSKQENHSDPRRCQDHTFVIPECFVMMDLDFIWVTLT